MTTEPLSEVFSGAEARRAARNAGAIAAARILSSALLFGWQLILGRALGEAVFGVYGTVGALFGIGVTVTAFSMSLIVIRDVARRPETAGRYLSATLVIQTVLGVDRLRRGQRGGAGLRRCHSRLRRRRRHQPVRRYARQHGIRSTAGAGAHGRHLGDRRGADRDPHQHRGAGTVGGLRFDRRLRRDHPQRDRSVGRALDHPAAHRRDAALPGRLVGRAPAADQQRAAGVGSRHQHHLHQNRHALDHQLAHRRRHRTPQRRSGDHHRRDRGAQHDRPRRRLPDDVARRFAATVRTRPSASWQRNCRSSR